MESSQSPFQGQTSLFQVYLRLRPPIGQNADLQNQKSDYLIVEPPEEAGSSDDTDGARLWSKYITVQPPNDSRKRAVEKFAFTKVFEERASQLEVFEETGMVPLIKGVLVEGRDGLVATLGVTGSGKSHTILGSKSQRGITQMSLDVLFKSLAPAIQSSDNAMLMQSLAASDPSEAQLYSARSFIESVYGDPCADRGRGSRAQTPNVSSRAQTPLVCSPSQFLPPNPSKKQSPSLGLYSSVPRPIIGYSDTQRGCYASTIRLLNSTDSDGGHVPIWPAPKKLTLPSQLPFWRTHRIKRSETKSQSAVKETPVTATFPRRHMAPRPSAFPQTPDVSDFVLSIPEHDEYAVLVSMYEVYNDRIFDLLSPSNGSSNRSANNNQKDSRRPLMFKPTEGSMDRKVVAGLRKVVCSTCEEALTVLETGLTERKVTGTGSNSVSSRSHGFFCVEVKKKIRDQRLGYESWVGNTLTIVDLAGSERARNAKTAGATLAEGGKINESLMYLGQCLQMQTNLQSGSKALVPFRQCKLTELLFSNSFPSSSQTAHSSHRIPQKANMIVTADPLGDFNATSQILRYSALAREVTVPRIPSVSSTILAIPAKPPHSGKSAFLSASAEELERAALEIAKLTDDYEALEMRLAEEEMAREEAEIRWKAAEEKCLLLDQEIREECFAEMEERIEDERRRWQQAWDEQTRRHESHLDRKLDLLSRGVEIHEDPEPSTEERVDELERENDMLRTRIAALERELLNRSPTKKNTTTSKKNTIPGRFDSLDYSFLKADSDTENSSLTISKKLGRLRLGENLPSSPLSQRERK
ncbi:conserved hypothetical protein, variant [Coccidioides immitis RMSCC 3703]|uniref:Kinesin motor domain-containing protein n=1 Tax=Coccidioides immitis RMSCC 3703 TaxID=454286 RepID=A0A0J8QHP7_COCIT|nr:conserved hypothetical protein, variant [Coccidioides immitis RMSCC 3703]